MRVTAQAKAETRHLILQAARQLFAQNGYDSTSTRDIARAAGFATGTLFNYFPTKEMIVAGLATEAMGVSLGETDGAGEKDLEEGLFAFVASGLRKLKTLRKYLPALLETSLSPLASVTDEATSLRAMHLQGIAMIAARHGHENLSPTALQLYWTLYTGVLMFWASDKSPRQEDTLALLDDSLNMFAGWLRGQSRREPEPQ